MSLNFRRWGWGYHDDIMVLLAKVVEVMNEDRAHQDQKRHVSYETSQSELRVLCSSGRPVSTSRKRSII